MRGSIRVIVGLLLTFGAVGGMDAGTDADLPMQMLLAAVGLYAMYSGVRAMHRA